MRIFTMMVFLCSLLCLCFLQGAVGARLGGEDSCFEQGIDYLGNDLQEGHYDSTSSAAECQKVCQRTNGCEAWTWDPTYHNACWKKSAKGQTQANSKVTSGPKYCEGDEPTTPKPGGETDSMRVMSYNLYGWNALVQNPWKAENVYKAIRQINPDLLGAQECEGHERDVAAAIGSDYAIAGSATAGHSIIYKTSVFTFEGQGVVNLHEQDQWGLRTVEYAHFTHRLSGKKVDHFNTHLCLCNGDQLLGSAKTIVEAIQQNRVPGSRIILTGDFNCDDGWEDTQPVKYLKGLLENTPVPLDDTFRTYNDESVDGATFPGKKGKIDYVMVDKGAVVKNAWIARNWDDQGKASDHWPIAAVVGL